MPPDARRAPRGRSLRQGAYPREPAARSTACRFSSFCAATAASSATAPWAVRRAAGTGCCAAGRQETCCPAAHGEATCGSEAGEAPGAAETIAAEGAVAAEGVTSTKEAPATGAVTSGKEASVTEVSRDKGTRCNEGIRSGGNCGGGRLGRCIAVHGFDGRSNP